MVVLGMDTDSKGSVAVLDLMDLTRPTLDVYPIPNLKKTLTSGTTRMSVDYHVLAALMADLTSFADAAWLEEQWSRPGQDVATMFGFGTTFGDCRTATAAGFLFNKKPSAPINFVPGAKWKHSLRLDDDKKKSIALATALFPACASAWKLISKHTSAAEASLIAFYGAAQLKVKMVPGVPVLPRVTPCSLVVESLLNGVR